MARARVKSGGPTRGRRRVIKMGMGSGKPVLKLRSGGKSRPSSVPVGKYRPVGK